MRIIILFLVLSVLLICRIGDIPTVAVASPERGVITSEQSVGQQTQASDVTLETPTGTLFGTLLLPSGTPPFAVVLLIAGSGLTDRDGNSVGLGKSDTLKKLAEGLAQAGIASLRYDKRGVGMSAPARTARNTFEIQAEDAARWANWLAQSPRFRALGIAGHSEGALVGTMAAQNSPARALVSLAGSARRFDEVMTEQFEMAVREGQLSQSSLVAMRGALAELRAGRTIDRRPPDIPRQLWPLFHPRAQEYLISIFRYDPVAEIAKLPSKGVQVFVVRGTTDLTGGAGDAALLAAAAGVKPVVIEGMNHELKTAPLNRAANDRVSEDARAPLTPELLKQLIPFLVTALK